MRVNGISAAVSKRTASKTSASGAKSVNEKNSISSLTGLGAASFGLSFAGAGRIIKLDKDTAGIEKDITDRMRSFGVNTPIISDDNKYILKGEKANPQINPITQEHIKNVLNNILVMDKEGLGHGDLEEEHVFYGKNGSVEFDCFRFNWEFGKDAGRQREFPNFYYPSNIREFEGCSLGSYLSKMNPPDGNGNPAKNFIRNYLPIASDFHAKRADFLKQSGIGTDEQIKYEQVLSKVFKNPDDDIIELFEDKIKHQYERRIAFTEWDEGNGACGHKADNNRAANGVKMYFDSIYDGSKYIEKINKFQKNSFGIKSKYLDYETKDMEHILNNTVNDACGMAAWTMNSDNPKNIFHRNIPQDEKEYFNILTDDFRKISAASKTLSSEAVKLKNNYSKLLETKKL